MEQSRETITSQSKDIKLEIGDFFPFLKIELANGSSFDLMNCVSPQPIVFLTVKNLSTIQKITTPLRNASRNVVLTILYQEKGGTTFSGLRLTQSKEVSSLLEVKDEPIVYLLNPNRRIVDITNLEKFLSAGGTSLVPHQTSNNIPYLLVDNVFSESLLERVIKFYNDNKAKATLHNSVNKNRYHVHPDPSLEKTIDNKLSRTVFPEVKKIFNFEVKYRENYKISSYNADSNGRFSGHRDTPHPYGHRRYAMSLCLNDEYEGGEFKLNEYGLCVKMKRNSALIFPGICSHEVNPVKSGSRMVIITFFTTKACESYRVKSDFFSGKELTYSQIYPV